ncbi:MAG: hypothetical protein WBA43_01605 [Elainellaceae cyanobacterium]
MTPPLLHPDDSSPQDPSSLDQLLHRQLRQSVSRYFYESCDGVMQALLLSCQWQITTTADALTLVIHCPNPATHHRVLNYLPSLARYLARFGNTARIHIGSADSDAPALDIQVDDYSLTE